MTISLLTLVKHSEEEARKQLSKYKKADLIDFIIHLCDKWILPDKDEE